MIRRRHARSVFSVVIAAFAAAAPAGAAWAHGEGAGGAQLPARAPAVAPEGEEARGILDKLEAPSAAAGRVDDAWKALGRAHGASLARDGEGARLLSRLALSWARAAKAAGDAASVEKRADAAETRARELADKLARARTLLSETEARRGQVSAEIVRAEAEVKAERDRTVELERQKSPGRKPAAPKPAQPAAPKPAGAAAQPAGAGR